MHDTKTRTRMVGPAQSRRHCNSQVRYRFACLLLYRTHLASLAMSAMLGQRLMSMVVPYFS